MDALTIYFFPKYLLIVFAFAGDSTITSESATGLVPPSNLVASDVKRKYIGNRRAVQSVFSYVKITELSANVQMRIDLIPSADQM